MADDKKNIPDAGKVDEHSKPGKVEPVKADPPVQDHSAPAKAEAPVIEGVSETVTFLCGGQKQGPPPKASHNPGTKSPALKNFCKNNQVKNKYRRG